MNKKDPLSTLMFSGLFTQEAATVSFALSHITTHMFQVASSQLGFVLNASQVPDAFLHGGEQRLVVLEDVFDVTEHSCKLLAREQRPSISCIVQDMLK